MGEEAKEPEINCPKGILDSIKISACMTFFFIIIILYNLGGHSNEYIQELVDSENMLFLVFKK